MPDKNQNLNAPKWDLSEIYKAPEDSKIAADLSALKQSAALFEKKYKGKIAKMNLTRLLAIFKEYEVMYRKIYLLSVYPEFAFSVDTKDQKISALMQRCEIALTEIQNRLIFFSLELGRHPKLPTFIEDKKASPYRFMFQKMLVNKKHQLKGEQERLLNIKSLTSQRGWVKLFVKTEAQIKISYQGKKIGMDQAVKFFHSSKRAVRKEIYALVTSELTKHNDTFAYVYNMLLLDKSQDDQIRKYGSPEQSRHDNNGITQKAVDILIESARKNNKLIGRFYDLRKKLLGVKEIQTYDRYAAINFGKTHKTFTFPEAVSIVRDAFNNFDPAFTEVFNELLAAKHIDAKTAPNKRGGAYCAEMPKSHLPYILMNYVGEERDIETLAHETGHAIQDTLTAKHPGTVAHPPLTIAETASVFCEMIVFEDLLTKTKTDKEKISLIVSKIDDILATIYRQISYLVFERRAHAMVKEKGGVSAEDLNNAWIESQKEIYGNTIVYPKGYEYWWEHILHFYEYPFYVYAYSFGNLLVFALWKEYKNAKKTGDQKKVQTFLSRYKRLLSTGGTRSTMETMLKSGFDPEDPEFWSQGFSALKDLIAVLAKLC